MSDPTAPTFATLSTHAARPAGSSHAARPAVRAWRWGPALASAVALFSAACGAADDPDLAPVAVAGVDQRLTLPPGGTVELVLDGARSFDPEGAPLHWRWQAVQSPNGLTLVGRARTDLESRVKLSTPGLYVFELVVSDGLLDSAPDHLNVLVASAPEAR